MLVTDEVFHADNGWLNEVHEVHPANMLLMSVTDDVSQVSTRWLNELHPLNMWLMSVTDDVFQGDNG